MSSVRRWRWACCRHFCLCLLAGAWLSMRAQKRVEEVNQRVQRIIAGDLRERLPHRNVDEPFSKLAVIVNGMLDEMETMIHALAGVGNDIAHDLRTPLTRARLALERGRTNATTLEQLQAVADKAIAGIDQSLVDHHGAVASGRDREQPAVGGVSATCALHEMLREVCDLYEPIAENKNIALRVEASQPLNVRGDRDLLFEAVANLVDNAIKFTPGRRQGGHRTAARRQAKPSCASPIPAAASASRSARPCCGVSIAPTRSEVRPASALASILWLRS